MNEFLKGILDGINTVIGNYGWSIVVFTLLLRIVLFPFDYKSRVSMRKTTKLQPQLAALQKKYANDKEKLNRKMSELYKKEKINPLSSCLPMLLTLPILFAMWTALRIIANEQMVSQVFTILQGQTPTMEGWLWVKNLWMPDSPFAAAWPDLNSLQLIPADIWQNAYNALIAQGVTLPAEITYDFAGNLQGTIQAIYAYMEKMPEYVTATSNVPGWSFNLLLTQVDLKTMYNGFFILPILAAVTQYLMTVLQPTQPTGTENQQAAGTGNFMKWFFPLFSLFVCSSYNAAFSLYWVMGNIIAAVQNIGINWYLDNKEKREAAIGEGTVK
ncbi:MAG TPA: YidC/Oxa1 family membrane protein insertase [Candidatus Egerieenecus merdigallinarum]|nr:YidC/Oxa1 family membrane protein insertase [Candidatus Egerieenecus merdigallinarum]